MGADVTGFGDGVRQTLSRGGVVAITGGRGSGRTTLLRTLASGLPAAWEQCWVDGRTADDLDVLPSESSGQVLLAVDDLHLLPGPVRQGLAAAAARGLPVLCTVTDEAESFEEVDRLVLGAHTVPAPALTEDELAATAAAVLGAAPDDVGLALLANFTGRRPGLLRRLLDGVQPRIDGDVTVLSEDVAGSRGALAWRRERLADPRLHRAARLVGRGEQLRRDHVAAAVGADAIEDGLRLGVFRLVGESLTVRDPLVAAVTAGPDRTTHGPEDAALLLDVIGADAGPAQRQAWAVEAGTEAGPAARAAAASRALEARRPRLALRLVGSVGDGPEILLARARALAAVGRADEAAQTFERLLRVDDDRIAAIAAIRLGDHRFFSELDPMAALAALEPTAGASSALGREAAALRDLVLSAIGRGAGAAPAAAEPVAAARLVEDLRRVLAGRVEDVDDVADLAGEDSAAGLPLRERSAINRALAALHVDGVPAGRRAAAELVDKAVDTRRPGALAQALGVRAHVEQLEGRLETAERTLRAASLRAEVDDEAGLPEVLRASRATVLCELGRLEEAAELLPAADARPGDLRVHLFGSGARVRLLAATDAAAAAEAAVHDIELGAATGHNVWAVLVGLQAARAGLAGAVVDAVLRAAEGTHGLSRRAAQVVETLASEDRASQVDAATAAAAFGLRRVAAEVLLQVGATRQERRRASALLHGLGPPRPDAAVQSEQLTRRELQVCRLAADGRTSREIGEELGVATRTVDNHLQRAYRKLGISRRGDLAAILGGSA